MQTADLEKLKQREYTKLNSETTKINHWNEQLLLITDSNQKTSSFLPEKKGRLGDVQTKLKKFGNTGRTTFQEKIQFALFTAERMALESEIALAEQSSQNHNQLVALYSDRYHRRNPPVRTYFAGKDR